MKIPKEFEDVFRGVDLTEDEIRILNWIAGWDAHTVNSLRSAIQKAQGITLSTLQAENYKLRAELEQVKAERDAAIECLKNKCPFCRKYLTCQGRTINNDCWEFFGLKED